MGTASQYLTKRHRDSSYYFQIGVPSRIAPQFQRRLVRLNLRTYEPAKARNMARRMAVLCQETFRQFEELPMTPELTVVLQQIRERLYNSLRRLMDQAGIDQVTKQGIYGIGTLQEVKEVFEERLSTDAQILANSDFRIDEANRQLIESQLQKLNVKLDTDKERQQLSLLLQHERTKHTHQLLQILLHRLEGNFHYEKDVVAQLTPHPLQHNYRSIFYFAACKPPSSTPFTVGCNSSIL